MTRIANHTRGHAAVLRHRRFCAALGVTPTGLDALARIKAGKPPLGGMGLVKLLGDGLIREGAIWERAAGYPYELTAAGEAVLREARRLGW